MAESKKINSLVSIVIPVYNVGQYLRRCLDSVVKQTYKNIEIIAVNDGSPDNSEQIIKEYTSIDSRVKLVTISHSGTSAAVAAGVQKANGEYIAFVDPDDYVGEDFIANFISEAEDCDVICMGYYEHSSSGITETKTNTDKNLYFTDKNYQLLKEDAIEKRKYRLGVRWDKLFKKDLLDNFILSYGELKLIIYEDWYFMQFMLLFFKKYKICSKSNSYFYCFSTESVMRSVRGIEDYNANIDKFKKADIILSNYSNEKVTYTSNRAYMLGTHYISQYASCLNKKDSCRAIKQILNNKDFHASLRKIKKYYKDSFPLKRYLKFTV